MRLRQQTTFQMLQSHSQKNMAWDSTPGIKTSFTIQNCKVSGKTPPHSLTTQWRTGILCLDSNLNDETMEKEIC